MSWLEHMGYGTNSNKKSFISRVKLLGGTEAMYRMTKTYKNLGMLGLKRKDLQDFLVKTCRNGW